MQPSEAALTSSSYGDRLSRSRRSWSAPACSVRHLLSRIGSCQGSKPSVSPASAADEDDSLGSAKVLAAVSVVRNPRLQRACRMARMVCSPSVHRVGRLPGSNSNSRDSGPQSCEEVNAYEGSGVNPSAVVSKADDAAASTLASQALIARLDAATSQISLLNDANERTRASYAQLEVEHSRLRSENRQLLDENERLKELVAKKENEMDEQLHLICQLQRRLVEFEKLVDAG